MGEVISSRLSSCNLEKQRKKWLPIADLGYLARGMLERRPIFSLCPPKIDVAFKIIIKFDVDPYWI
jgi:hypothetical protein